MKIFQYLFCLCLLSVFSSNKAISQSTGNTAKITKVTKFKPPKVKSVLGINQDGAVVTIDEANQLIALPLKIADSLKNNYNIDSYRLVYKKKGNVEDENGKKQVMYSTVAGNFDKTPLPPLWIENIRDKFQSSEQLIFFDIIVKDKQGRRFYAPDLKITIQ